MSVAGLEVQAPDGIGEIVAGTDLAALILDRLPGLLDGDVVVLTSKIVSKAEGRVVRVPREEAITAETVRLLARRGATRIVQNKLGLVMAAAGVDASNVTAGDVVLLPEDPDGTARALRATLQERAAVNVAVLITDTAGRAWRHGQTDLAIGAAGIAALDSFEGRVDSYGNPLAVTAPAVIDEIAGVAELVTGKLGGRPLSLVRGLGGRVLPPNEHGTGAAVLIREPDADMFGLGAREAVLAAVIGTDRTGFGAPASAAELRDALAWAGFGTLQESEDLVVALVAPGVELARLAILTFAFGWQPDPGHDATDGEPIRLRPHHRSVD